MKKFFSILLVVTMLLTITGTALADKPTGGQCTKISDGTLQYSAGHFLAGTPLVTGFDAYGYNYQGHMFDGSYANVYLGGDGFPAYTGDDTAYVAANPTVVSHWAWPYRTTRVLMKWNDAWLSNMDCDGDGKLDRHYGFPSYVNSGAWETNHMWDSYELNGRQCKWNDFYKIAALPATGIPIWGEFSIIQEVYNDPCAGYHGLLYKSPGNAGLGG
jgi:hypothetical protein